MAIKFEVTRPDDLLNLQFEGINLRLDAGQQDSPALVVENADQPAFLVVTFPPQTIAESAFFESSIVKPDAKVPDPDAGKVTEALPGAGNVAARLAHPSRLVFKVAPKASIPFTLAGVLDWSRLEPSVNPIAAVPPDPSDAQIAAAPDIGEPTATQTALELPYRLIVSPNMDARWAHRLEPFTIRGRTELWHSRLQLRSNGSAVELSAANPAPLRAIWSDDYNPISPPGPSDPDPDLGRTAMSRSDRHEIVILTSAFHHYEVDIELQIVINPGAAVWQRGRGVPVKFTVPYVPEPFFADQLMLSPLGGWLRSHGQWDPPRRVKPLPPFKFPPFKDLPLGMVGRGIQPAPLRPVVRDRGADVAELFWPGLGGVFFPQPEQERLELSEWIHVATQGRDHYVRIVYEGELWPYRNRAALIKVTERKFKEQNGVVVAYLFQRMFIVVREPEKKFTGRDMPFTRVQLTTLVTPDIADPTIIPGTQRSFWVDVMTSATTRARFKFHAIGTDHAGNSVDFTVPMMFVSFKEQDAQRAVAAGEYNASKDAWQLAARAAAVPGQKLVFAERNPGSTGDNTQLITRALNFVMDTAGTAPRLLEATVNIPQVQQLLGTDAPTTIRYFKDYVDHDFDAATGVFAEIVREDFSKLQSGDPVAGLVADTMGVKFSSDQAGGFATPNLAVSTLSRELGPLAGKAADAIADTFDPASFFQKGLAQLFGTFDLTDLLPPGTLGANAPKLRTATTDNGADKLIVATLDWEPQVKDVDLDIAAFKKSAQTKLVIHGRIEKPVKLGAPPGADVTYQFDGKLNDFQVSVLKAVFLNFVEFAFTARSNVKTDVRVKLDTAMPVKFDGDLKFVEELRKAIPPDLFGKGPSLDITASGIRAGFAFALPPVAVGVFALKDVSLGAVLALPFTDGKPTFDFSVSERPHPFLLAVGIFGGGGFFRLQLDTAGLKLVEAALEFGAAASVDLGVASGGVQIMAGIYFKLERKEPANDLLPTLSGYLRMGGYLSVLGLIKVSLEFNLSFTYDGTKDKAYGRATLTVKVEVAFFSKSVEVTVERAFGGSSGDPKFGELFTGPDVWSEYALAFA
jgi:hypothetical protein